MRKSSARILTNQTRPHPKLKQIPIDTSTYMACYPVSLNILEICQKIKKEQEKNDWSLLLDSGCGTGDSTINIAKSHPDYLVLGIDKSSKRLHQAQKKIKSENVRFITANLVEFWIGLKLVNASIAANFILYPNPWPKQKHLKKRWHAHPVMPLLPMISKYIELRTNWRIYAEEFCNSLTKLTGAVMTVEKINPNNPISAFEEKYFESNHDLFRLRYGKLDPF